MAYQPVFKPFYYPRRVLTTSTSCEMPYYSESNFYNPCNPIVNSNCLYCKSKFETKLDTCKNCGAPI